MLGNIHLYTNEIESQNQKVKKIPHHLNKLECCFFEYLYTYVKENKILNTNISISIDEFIRVMNYQSGSDNNVRKAVASLADQKFTDESGEIWSLYEIKNLTAKERKMEIVLSEKFFKIERPYCSLRLLPYYLLLDKYYSRVLLLYLLNHKPDGEMERIDRDNDEVYKFTIGREEDDKEIPNLYKVLCSDLTHCNLIPPIWEKNYGYFNKTVLEPITEEIRKKALIDIQYDKSKVDLDGKKHRQNKQLAFCVRGRDDWFLANIPRHFWNNGPQIINEDNIIDDNTEILVTDNLEDQVEYIAHTDEVAITSPENIAAIYPKAYNYLLGYNMSPDEATELIQSAESHMAKESYKKRERWVERFLEFYLKILCPNKTVTRMDDLQYHVKQDSKKHAKIIDSLVKML